MFQNSSIYLDLLARFFFASAAGKKNCFYLKLHSYIYFAPAASKKCVLPFKITIKTTLFFAPAASYAFAFNIPLKTTLFFRAWGALKIRCPVSIGGSLRTPVAGCPPPGDTKMVAYPPPPPANQPIWIQYLFEQNPGFLKLLPVLIPSPDDHEFSIQ